MTSHHRKSAFLDQFIELFPQTTIPSFYWSQIIGNAGDHDFGISDDWRLVVCDVVVELLKKHSLNNAFMERYLQ